MKMKECLQTVIRLLSSIDSKLSAKNTGMPSEHDENTQRYEEAKNRIAQQNQELQQLEHTLQQARHSLAQESEVRRKAERQLQESKGAFPPSLAKWAAFQTQLSQDRELQHVLLGQYADEEALPQLIRLIVIVAQWEQVETVWDELKSRCDRENRQADQAELSLLQGCVEIHNLAYTGNYNRAALQDVEIGSRLDVRKHTRATPRGDQITAQRLPALLNAGGITVRQAYVETE